MSGRIQRSHHGPTTASEARAARPVAAYRVALGFVVLGLGGCAGQTIAPSYEANSPDLVIAANEPEAAAVRVEDAGSFCLEITESWHRDGETPDGQPLWARDTLRRVVPCP